MNWDAADFAVAITLVISVGLVFYLATRWSSNSTYRIAVGVALAASFLLVWINGAVGIIGHSSNDANMMYAGVLVVGLMGALITRFQAQGLSRTLFATAVAQGLVGVVALGAGWGAEGSGWPWDVLILTVFFVVLWSISGVLFRRAARPSP